MTEASYNTNPKDVEVLLSGVGKNLTLFTCTPVGGIDGRWIIKAKYKEENTQNAVQEKEVNFKDISVQKKIRYNKLLDGLSEE